MAYRISRLKRVEEKRAVSATVKYVVLTVIIIFVLFNFGLPALSRFTLFIEELTGQNVTNDDDNGPPLAPPQIVNLPTHTKEKTLRVSGNTRPGITVSIFFNDEKSEVLANASGEFNSTFELSRGENTIHAYAVTQNGKKSANSKNYTVVYDSEPPKLEIITPENGHLFTGRNNNQIQIEGQTELGARISINDRIAIVRGDGKFDFPVTLDEGENVFKIKSTDEAGNETGLEFKLTYSL